jgi:hypothetical protein
MKLHIFPPNFVDVIVCGCFFNSKCTINTAPVRIIVQSCPFFSSNVGNYYSEGKFMIP